MDYKVGFRWRKWNIWGMSKERITRNWINPLKTIERNHLKRQTLGYKMNEEGPVKRKAWKGEAEEDQRRHAGWDIHEEKFIEKEARRAAKN